MKNLKLLLLGLITPLFIGSSFAFDLTADEIDYLNNNALIQGSYTNEQNVSLYHNTDSLDIPNICVIFSGFVRNGTASYNIFPSSNTSWFPESATVHNVSTPYFLYCTAFGVSNYLRLTSDGRQAQISFSTDYYWVLDANKIINGYLGFDVQGLIDDLSRCDTSVQQCLIDKESLSGSLASCNADKISLNNNIDSLTLQLQNCLGQSCQGSGDFGSGIYFNQYSLYRTDDEIDYSTPITNNLFLPLGYKGKINEDNILSIAKINTLETAYQFADEDKPMVVNSMSLVMLFFLGTGLLIVAIMYLRRFISKK